MPTWPKLLPLYFRPIILTTIGLLLLTTASAKLFGLHIDTLPNTAYHFAPWVNIAVIEWEFVLGVWLISRLAPNVSWLLASVTFATFAVVSMRAGWIGVADCGCFGAIKTSPWVALAVDMVVLLALLIVRPSYTHTHTPPLLSLNRLSVGDLGCTKP